MILFARTDHTSTADTDGTDNGAGDTGTGYHDFHQISRIIVNFY